MNMFKSNYFVILALLFLLAVFTSSCATTPVSQEKSEYIEKAGHYEDMEDYVYLKENFLKKDILYKKFYNVL